MKSLKDEDKNVTFQAATTTATTAATEVPSLLLVLESCFLDDIDCSKLLINVPVNVLIRWESDSSVILRDGLAKMNWWEKHFQQSYPTTYERLVLLFSGSYAEGRGKKGQHFFNGNVDESGGCDGGN
jgi:hypothetical protein